MPKRYSESNNGQVKVRGKDDACCGMFFLKYVLFIFNFIFWMSGCAILAVGLWTLLDKHTYASLLTTHTYAATTYLLIGTGIFILIVGFLGCCGAQREHRVLLMTYAGFLLLVFLLEAVIGVVAYMYEAQLHDELVHTLNNTMLENYRKDEAKSKAVDHMQMTFKCCGAGSFQDWRYSWWLTSNPSVKNLAPDSCCLTYSKECALRDHPSNIYYDGCVGELELYLKRHLIILGAVGLGICCLQIFGIIFACCLAKRIKEFEESGQANYWS